jgi:N6-adenosine-specific RNA methylase IME4
MKRSVTLALMLAAFLAGSPAFAQSDLSVRLRGTIDAVTAQSVTVTTLSGQTLTIAVPAKAPVMNASKARLHSIKPGSFIGVAAQPQPDGTLVALEVHAFAENLRGTGEGNYPWDLQPGSTMTNGSVGSVVGTSGRTLTVQYAGGEKTIQVPKTVPVVIVTKGSHASLKPGRKAMVAATKVPDGTMTAQFILVGKPGVTPPM